MTLRALALCLLGLWLCGCRAEEPPSLLLATTTSVRDSGLLDALLPHFSERSRIGVRVVAVGSGAALRMGADGNADALVTHAPAGEAELVASGAALERQPFMHNYFVLAGPSADPAHARGAPVLDALRRIWDGAHPYVSRADDSGTHRKEVALLRLARLDPDADRPGLTRTGTGMGLTLQVAGERRAYALSDLGTFLAFRARTGLERLSREEPLLANEYAVLRIDPARFPGVRAVEAEALAAYLLDPDTQARIAEFGSDRFDEPLFRPGGLSP